MAKESNNYTPDIYALNIICPFCNKPFDADMEFNFEVSTMGGSAGVGDKIQATIDIVCFHCKRLVYKKYIEEDLSK